MGVSIVVNDLSKDLKKISDSLLLCEYPEVSTHASDCQCPRPRTSWNRMLQTYQVARTWVTWAGDNFSTCFFCVHFMICDHVWVWVKLRVLERRKAFVIFRMIWNQSCEKGKVTVMTFWPISIYAYIYICYGQNIMGYNGCNHTSIPYSKWESKHNGCMNPCEGIDDWWPSSKNSSSFSSLASFHWSGLFLQPTLSTSRVKRVWAMPSPLPRRKRDSVG